MVMMRAVIIDDEINNIDNLKILLSRYCPDIILAGEAGNAEEGAEMIINLNPDLVFLDIQMPEKSGFDLLKSLPHHNFEVIFVTGFDQYGIQAIRFSAIDYLVKPIELTELKSAVTRAKEKIEEKKQNEQLKNLLQMLMDTHKKSAHRIGLSSAKETRFVQTGQIIRCQAENNYTIFSLLNGEQIVVSRPMFEYDEILSEYGFIRCHHSHLVNRIYVKSLLKEDSGYLLLEDDSKIPISRLKKDAVKSALKGR